MYTVVKVKVSDGGKGHDTKQTNKSRGLALTDV